MLCALSDITGEWTRGSTTFVSDTYRTGNVGAGGIYLYGLGGDDWNLQKKFQYPDTVGFGRSVGISEQAIVVTDPIFTRSGMAQSGAAFAVDYLQSNETLC